MHNFSSDSGYSSISLSIAYLFFVLSKLSFYNSKLLLPNYHIVSSKSLIFFKLSSLFFVSLLNSYFSFSNFGIYYFSFLFHLHCLISFLNFLPFIFVIHSIFFNQFLDKEIILILFYQNNGLINALKNSQNIYHHNNS